MFKIFCVVVVWGDRKIYIVFIKKVCDCVIKGDKFYFKSVKSV